MAVGVNFIALAGVAAQISVIMLLYFDPARFRHSPLFPRFTGWSSIGILEKHQAAGCDRPIKCPAAMP